MGGGDGLVRGGVVVGWEIVGGREGMVVGGGGRDGFGKGWWWAGGKMGWSSYKTSHH